MELFGREYRIMWYNFCQNKKTLKYKGKTMFKLFKLILISSLVMITPSSLMADATVSDTKSTNITHQEAIDNLMNLSGLSGQIPELSSGLINSFVPYLTKMRQDIRVELSNVINKSFGKEVMLQTIRDEVSKSVSLEDTLNMLNWYNSDVGKEITKAEDRAMAEVDVEGLMSQKDALFKDKQRVALCTQIEEQAQITDFLVDTQIEVIKATQKVTQPSSDSKAQDDYFDALKKEVKKSIKEQTILSLLKSYESIETDKMKRYLEFLRKETTKNFLVSGYGGIQKAILNGTNRVLKEAINLAK